MNHWPIAPVLIPLAAAVISLLVPRAHIGLHRAIALLALAAVVVSATTLVHTVAGGEVLVYQLGEWPAPYGIVLVVDHLSALMVALTALLAIASLLHALAGTDRQGRNFHALFQIQLMGLNGAFLTGDLFNLFVFFEVLLIASYALLLHGGGDRRIAASLHYVVFNLVASALFLIGVGVLFGTLGTLNMADVSRAISTVSPDQLPLVRAGIVLLLVVFLAKAALAPLYLWLPEAYANAHAAVAALFTVLTKVGVYATLRIGSLLPPAELEAIATWLVPLALLTLILGALGAVASNQLRRLTAYLVVSSTGVALAAIGLFRVEGLQAGLYYLVHSTLITAVLFLLADRLAGQRGPEADRLRPAPAVAQPALLGVLFAVAALTAAGLPPFSGFIGKLLVLQSSLAAEGAVWIWLVVLAGGLLSLVALAHAGMVVFWQSQARPVDWPKPRHASLGHVPAALLLGAGVLMVVLAGPITDYTGEAARQLLQSSRYADSVLGPPR